MTAYPYDDLDIKSKVQKLMQDIGYEGLFDVEFIVDKDGTMNFTEINFRNSIWDYIGTFDGLSYPLIWAESTLQGKFDEKWNRNLSREYTAMVEPIDYGIRVVKSGLNLAKWIEDFKNADVLFYFDREDVAPFEEMVDNWEIYS